MASVVSAPAIMVSGPYRPRRAASHKQLAKVDLVIEVRVPASPRPPATPACALDARAKQRLLVINRRDMVNETARLRLTFGCAARRDPLVRAHARPAPA